MENLPYLTPSDLCIGGELKQECEDFIVDEIPAYLPSGEGEHLFLWIEKRDISADFLADCLARTLQISRNDIGVAGLKDRRAITRQWVSVPIAVESRIGELDRDDLKVLHSARHGNKLKTGHLKGNRFEVIIRETSPTALVNATTIAESIALRGAPNYYGTQRFGIENGTLELGLELLRGETSPAKIPFKKRKFLIKLALSAVQSELFNRVLARRIENGTAHQVEVGDVLQVLESGGMFLVEDSKIEQRRVDAGEVVPTGPLFGPKMKFPTGESLQAEQAVLAELHLTMESFEKFKKQTPGARRALFIFPQSLQIEEHASGLRFRFDLPSGCYATTILREFMKDPST